MDYDKPKPLTGHILGLDWMAIGLMYVFTSVQSRCKSVVLLVCDFQYGHIGCLSSICFSSSLFD